MNMAKAPRRRPTLKCRLAAALCALTDSSGNRLIPHEHAKLMTEDDVLSLFQWDHYPIRHIDDGPLAHWNLEPLLIMAHREKTAKVDAPQLAKARAVRDSEAIHKAKLASRSGDDLAAAALISTVVSRPRLKRKPKISSRPFGSRKTRRFGNRQRTAKSNLGKADE
ncbi:hypothetical protein OOZ54_12525 [Rhodopseudomonas palustris]|uniref:hypothetical protein n=1 Tax=Rhodopseudomonas palustris TaxID=1076 RepID=UPI0022F042D0|nr:hypothetical protein [Rhodopseudomonas palustris]WBU27519.1 hypothetical protein OOZ54_12525 [Rhodopseudomonas palustris]